MGPDFLNDLDAAFLGHDNIGEHDIGRLVARCGDERAGIGAETSKVISCSLCYQDLGHDHSALTMEQLWSVRNQTRHSPLPPHPTAYPLLEVTESEEDGRQVLSYGWRFYGPSGSGELSPTILRDACDEYFVKYTAACDRRVKRSLRKIILT